MIPVNASSPGGSWPRVTVIALCFNHGRFVRGCLESIRSQTFRDFELIIMDDCSTDDSVAVINQWIAETGCACQFIRHQVNQGICRTLNEAVLVSKGRFVTLIATDDLWLPEKLADQIAAFNSLPDDVAVVYSDAYQMTEDGCRIEQTFMQSHNAPSPAPHGDVFSHLVNRNFIPAVTPMMRRSCLLEVGLYDEALCYEDWDMWLRLAMQYKFAFSSSVGASYRIVATSMTRTVLSKWGRAQIFSAMRIAAKLVDSNRLVGATLAKKKSEVTRFAWRLCAMADNESADHLAMAQRIDPRYMTSFLLRFARNDGTRALASRLAGAYIQVRSRIDWYTSRVQMYWKRAERRSGVHQI